MGGRGTGWVVGLHGAGRATGWGGRATGWGVGLQGGGVGLQGGW